MGVETPAAHMYWGLKTIMQSWCGFCFFGDKEQLLKTLLTYTLIRFTQQQFTFEEKVHAKDVVDVLRGVGELIVVLPGEGHIMTCLELEGEFVWGTER